MTPGKVFVIPFISRMGVMTRGSSVAAGDWSARPCNVNASAGNEKGASARKIGAKAPTRQLAGLLELVKLVVTRIDQCVFPVGRVDRDRRQQIGRYNLDLVVVGFCIVDLRLAS